MLGDARSRVGCVRQVSQRVINGVRVVEEDAMGIGNEWQKSDGVLREGGCVYMGGVRCMLGGRGAWRAVLRLLATGQLQREEGPRRACAQARRVQSE